MPPTPPPAADQNATPVYGVRWPKPTSKALQLPRDFEDLAEDFETVLLGLGIPPVIVGTPVVAGSAGARDTHWGTPGTATQRLALQALGACTIRTDLGTTERYYANLTDGGSNPGGVRVAGWYPVGGQPYQVGVDISAAQTTSASVGALVAIKFDAETTADPFAMHDVVTNNTRLVAKVAGIYDFEASAYFNTTTGTCILQGQLNGSTGIPGAYDRKIGAATTGTDCKFKVRLQMAANDYVEALGSSTVASVGLGTGGSIQSPAASLTYIGPS